MASLRATTLLLALLAVACSAAAPTHAPTSSSPPEGMVTVPAGVTHVRCQERPETGCEVALPAFFIDRAEVTIGAYKACSESGACPPITRLSSTCDYHAHVRGERVERPELAHLPATCIEADFAERYCAWVGKRLPTGAEWIRAALGDDPTRRYPWGDDEPTCEDAAICRSPAGGGNWPHAVGSHPRDRSPFGALDMAGNVRELTTDGWCGGTYLHGLEPEQLRRCRVEHLVYGHSGFRCARDLASRATRE